MPSASDIGRILSAAQSDVGRTRSENQDAYGEFSTPAGERLFVVADGMGGHRGGATASRLCVEAIGRAFTDGTELAEARLRRGIELANARIHSAAERDLELTGMGTTAVALVLAPDGSGAIGWVGDSRVYRFRDGSLEQLSTDHSVVGEMVRSGALSAEEAESHPHRNELLRAIGPREFVEAEIETLRHRPGDRFLLCSDGLWGPVSEAELSVVLGSELPELAVKKLIAKANERGGPDNVTAQIASVGDGLAAAKRPPARSRATPEPASRAIPRLALGAGIVTAALIAVAVYALSQGGIGGFGQTAPPAALAQSASAAGTELPAAKLVIAGRRSAPGPEAARPKPAAAGKTAVKTPVAVPARAKSQTPEKREPPRKPAAAATAPAKKPSPLVTAAKSERKAPVRAKPAPPALAEAKAPAPALELLKDAPEKGAPEATLSAEIAPDAPREGSAADPAVAEVPERAAPPAPTEASPPQSDSPSFARDEIERFLADWETAISSKDFKLYARLGLPGNEQSFQTHYIQNGAKLEFSLRDFEQTSSDQLVVRVQMVLEIQDGAGPRRVDEERRFVVKQTPSGLRYSGVPKM